MVILVVFAVFVCVGFCRSPSVEYDSFLDRFECKQSDEHHIEGQEIGVSLYITVYCSRQSTNLWNYQMFMRSYL